MRAQSVSCFAALGVSVGSLLVSMLGASGCGGGDSPPIFPQHLDIPVAPPAEPRARKAHEPSAPPPPSEPAAPPAAEASPRPPAVALTVSPAAAEIVAASDR